MSLACFFGWFQERNVKENSETKPFLIAESFVVAETAAEVKGRVTDGEHEEKNEMKTPEDALVEGGPFLFRCCSSWPNTTFQRRQQRRQQKRATLFDPSFPSSQRRWASGGNVGQNLSQRAGFTFEFRQRQRTKEFILRASKRVLVVVFFRRGAVKKRKSRFRRRS